MPGGVAVFFKYVAGLLQTYFRTSDSNDIALSLGLYLVYPAIMWLLLDKFHGLCGKEKYVRKMEAVAACQSLFVWFTILLRTYKLWVMILNKADATGKEDASSSDLKVDRASSFEENGSMRSWIRKQFKCQAWMHLVQEFASIAFVAFLVFICLPVLAFWFMFISIFVSCYNLWSIGKRIWNQSQESAPHDGDSAFDDEQGDVEFQEFLNNFSEDEDDDN